MIRHARRVTTTALAIVLALLLLAIAARALARSRTTQLFGTLVSRVDTADPVVALTFDDGPTPAYLDGLLDALAAKDVRATFFVNGVELSAAPDAGRRLVAAGHELGNHSWSHARMVLKPPGFVRQEVERTDAAIRAAGFTGEIRFRPPYGYKLAVLPWILWRTGRTTVMWDVEPDSSAVVASSAERIAAHVSERARPGSIVLLHVWYPARETSRAAVPLVIDGLRAKGYRFVTVGELIRDRYVS